MGGEKDVFEPGDIVNLRGLQAREVTSAYKPSGPSGQS